MKIDPIEVNLYDENGKKYSVFKGPPWIISVDLENPEDGHRQHRINDLNELQTFIKVAPLLMRYLNERGK